MSTSGPPLKIFVTGLCLQGNKGGPALALSMREALARHLPLERITLSVPGGAELIHEQRAARRYDFTVVESIDLRNVIPPKCLRDGRLRRVPAWLAALRQSDLVVDMTAISYVGPPVGTSAGALNGRFFNFSMARLLGKPFMAWTQSYGPLSTPLVRGLAKLDLSSQSIVFCRGDDCAEAVRNMMPRASIRSFPDVATTLPADLDAGARLLAQHLPKSPAPLATVSPSAMIYARASNGHGHNVHVTQVAALVDRLHLVGYDVALVPHTLRQVAPTPRSCDLEVCRLVLPLVQARQRCALIEDDVGPAELKGVIAQAELHIGGRYHSVVAALSSAVPAISLAWHPKYKDLMDAYGLGEYVVDATSEATTPTLLSMVDRVIERRGALRRELSQRQAQIAAQVDENARLFCELVAER